MKEAVRDLMHTEGIQLLLLRQFNYIVTHRYAIASDLRSCLKLSTEMERNYF